MTVLLSMYLSLLAVLLQGIGGARAPGYLRHGTDWLAGNCASRERQSPINFDTKLKEPPDHDFEFHYVPLQDTYLRFSAFGGVMYADMSTHQVGGVAYNNAFYQLVRMDFHVESEHTIRGKHLPMEIQLVHKHSVDPNQQLIISILVWSELVPPPLPFNIAPAFARLLYAPPSPLQLDFNWQLQLFLTQKPPAVDGSFVDLKLPKDFPLDLNQWVGNPFVPSGNSYLEYAGSLTSPPCVDKVTWLVRRTTMIASNAQVASFANSLFSLTGNTGNNREIMPNNNRQVSVAAAKWSAVLNITKAQQEMPLGPNARTDGEFKISKLAEKVKTSSDRALRYAKDFSRRVHDSDVAYAAHLNPPTGPPPTANPAEDRWQKAVHNVRSAIYSAAHGTWQNTEASMRAEGAIIHADAAGQAHIVSNMLGR